MTSWREQCLTTNTCPVCGTAPLTEGRAACAECLKRGAVNSRRWRVKNKPKYNAYMRAYMQARRARQSAPAALQSEAEALRARIAELQDAIARTS